MTDQGTDGVHLADEWHLAPYVRGHIQANFDSVRAAARRIEIGYMHLHNILYRAVNPTPKTVDKILRGLGLTLETLMQQDPIGPERINERGQRRQFAPGRRSRPGPKSAD